MTICQAMLFTGVSYRRETWDAEAAIHLIDGHLIYRRFISSHGWRYITTKDDLIAENWQVVIRFDAKD